MTRHISSLTVEITDKQTKNLNRGMALVQTAETTLGMYKINSSSSSAFFDPKVLIFSFLHKNICCGYSLEAPCSGPSNYPQYMYLWRNKKNINLIPTLI